MNTPRTFLGRFFIETTHSTDCALFYAQGSISLIARLGKQ